MEIIKVKRLVVMLLAFTLVLIGCQSSENNRDSSINQNTIVILKFKTQPEKGLKALEEFNSLIEKVRQEPHFVKIKIHVDSKDDTNILLYEEWEDQDYYNTEHMETDYMKAFMANSVNFLAGPPEITFWKLENVFN
ncbi:putative quinol monooxygenase [Hanstruepera flava]|uniref:putative quinol monooxygenase n=1 Tax=Hanstruepera flava TaxID=2930218 RepID=UPI00202852B9|nr:putative quinol monooxygenase [Hanstruepera flava]